MEERNIYQDISERTGGDIYIGVVGPVRTGKSTFIKKFMDTLVIPNISSQSQKERAVDELPQSAAGKCPRGADAPHPGLLLYSGRPAEPGRQGGLRTARRLQLRRRPAH